jgi:hypothetical protein
MNPMIANAILLLVLAIAIDRMFPGFFGPSRKPPGYPLTPAEKNDANFRIGEAYRRYCSGTDRYKRLEAERQACQACIQEGRWDDFDASYAEIGRVYEEGRRIIAIDPNITASRLGAALRGFVETQKGVTP